MLSQCPALLHSLYRNCHERSYLDIVCLTSCLHPAPTPWFRVLAGFLVASVSQAENRESRNSEKEAPLSSGPVPSRGHQGRLLRGASDPAEGKSKNCHGLVMSA